MDYQEYRVEIFAGYSKQHVPLRAVQGKGKRRYDPASESPQPLYYWVFPNFMLNINPEELHNTIVNPLAPERTLTISEWFVAPGTQASFSR